jgi:PKD repeat protein
VDVTLELVPPDSNHELIGMTPTSLPGLSADVGERPNVTVPDADLRAVDSEGRVTGVTEDGEFVNEIPGAEASGDRVQGPEWISVPSDADVEFEVSTADVQQYVNETGASEENATISYTTEVTEVGENPQLTTVNGTLTVTNTTTTRTNTTAGPGETKTVTQSQLPAVCDTCSAPADPDGDGLYEDVDGNGLVGFGDVIVLYENLGSRAVTDHVARYDYDGNGLVGFGDVIDLYETL